MILYEEILNVQKKLAEARNEKKEVVLTENESVELAKILEKAQGKWIPSEDEMYKYNSNIMQIKEYQKNIKTTDLIPALLEEMDVYNEKYHNEED